MCTWALQICLSGSVQLDFFFCWRRFFFFLLIRVGYIQFVQGKELQQRALDNRLKEVPVEAKRGAILDRNNNDLAVSVSADSVGAFPRRSKTPAKPRKSPANFLRFLIWMRKRSTAK